MIPLALLPGAGQWAGRLDEVAARPEPLWIWGAPGSGTSTLAQLLADRRGAPAFEAGEAALAVPWLAEHPGGVVAAHAAPPPATRCLELRLPAVDEDPACVSALLAHLAREEGLEGPPPPALGALPCPGNLRELRNRVLRWKLLGQLPEPLPPAPALDTDHLATHLHALERFLLHRALRRAYGNRVEAARRLGVSRRQLYLLIARHGDPVREEPPSGALPRRLAKRHPGQNSSQDTEAR